eukprot:gene12620-15848_t
MLVSRSCTSLLRSSLRRGAQPAAFATAARSRRSLQAYVPKPESGSFFLRPLASQVPCPLGRTMASATEAPASNTTSSGANPLLEDWTFPPYDRVEACHVVPGIMSLLSSLNEEIDSLEKNVTPTWEGLVNPLEMISDKLQRTWGIVGHLKGVKDSEELRKVVEESQPEIVKLPLYEAFKALKEDASQWEAMTGAQKRAVDLELRGFELGGVALEGEAKEKYNAIQQELSVLSTKFSNNVLDSTKAFKRLVTAKEDADGLPASALGLAAQQAQKEVGHEGATAEEGPWLFTLDFPSYQPVMMHAKNRGLREEMYRAFASRASTGEQDNAPIIEKVLTLKQEKAKLLGFPNFAELSMASKMATLETAESLLEELRSKSFAAAEQDLKEVTAFAAKHGLAEELKWWDISFYAERLREDKYSINEEELRPYFSLPNVLDGLFMLAKRLFDVDIVAVDGMSPVWNDDVRFFQVQKGGKPKAYFYLDPYSRPAEKRGGAWMAEVVGQSKLMSPADLPVRLPVAQMVCNQVPPIGGKPSLMTFREVETLFHEFGHAMQHMCTEVEEGLVSGIRGVEWDAVELPSQFMENWAYDEKTLYSFAKHYESDEPLPKDLFHKLKAGKGVCVGRERWESGMGIDEAGEGMWDKRALLSFAKRYEFGESFPEDLFHKLKAAKTFRSGSMMMRQVHFSCIDLELHSRYTPGQGESVFDRDQALAAKTQAMPPFPEDRFLCSFSHIFAGGYSAGYFSYKWAEVLSADAFAAFEEAGLDDEDAVKTTGARFRDTVLALGGSVAPAEVFKQFRGREPSTEALLKHNDLLVAA